MVWRRRLSVCGSATKLVNKIHTEPFQLGPSNLVHTTYDKRTIELFSIENPIDFQGQGSKVKVTCYTMLLNHVNMIQT